MLLVLLIIIPLLYLYNAFSWGYVLFCLYNWFVLSAMPTLPVFTTLQFVGFSIFANALIRHVPPMSIKSEYTEDRTQYYVGLLMSPWITLFFAWLLHAYYF
jgi:hypothetical protein